MTVTPEVVPSVLTLSEVIREIVLPYNRLQRLLLNPFQFIKHCNVCGRKTILTYEKPATFEA
jgi:hypothetical protein